MPDGQGQSTKTQGTIRVHVACGSGEETTRGGTDARGGGPGSGRKGGEGSPGVDTPYGELDILCFSAQWGIVPVYWCIYVEGLKNPSKEHPNGEPGTGDTGDDLKYNAERRANEKDKNVEGNALQNGGAYSIVTIDRDTFDLNFTNASKVDAACSNAKIQLTLISEPRRTPTPPGGTVKDPTIDKTPVAILAPRAWKKTPPDRVPKPDEGKGWGSTLGPGTGTPGQKPGRPNSESSRLRSVLEQLDNRAPASPFGLGELLLGRGSWSGSLGQRSASPHFSVPFLYVFDSVEAQTREWMRRLDMAGVDAELIQNCVIPLRFRKTGEPVTSFGVATAYDAVGAGPAFPWGLEVYPDAHDYLRVQRGGDSRTAVHPWVSRRDSAGSQSSLVGEPMKERSVMPNGSIRPVSESFSAED